MNSKVIDNNIADEMIDLAGKARAAKSFTQVELDSLKASHAASAYYIETELRIPINVESGFALTIVRFGVDRDAEGKVIAFFEEDKAAEVSGFSVVREYVVDDDPDWGVYAEDFEVLSVHATEKEAVAALIANAEDRLQRFADGGIPESVRYYVRGCCNKLAAMVGS